MDIAAQNIQGKVQNIAKHGDDNKHHHVPRHGAQRIEHACDNGAGEHEGHEPGVGEHIGENAGNAVIQISEQSAQSADDVAIVGSDLAGQQHDQSDGQQDQAHCLPGQKKSGHAGRRPGTSYTH